LSAELIDGSPHRGGGFGDQLVARALETDARNRRSGGDASRRPPGGGYR